MAFDVNTPTLILEDLFFFFPVSVVTMDSQLLVCNHTVTLNVREGRVLEGEAREMFENL